MEIEIPSRHSMRSENWVLLVIWQSVSGLGLPRYRPKDRHNSTYFIIPTVYTFKVVKIPGSGDQEILESGAEKF
jgi:hypothetical protein